MLNQHSLPALVVFGSPVQLEEVPACVTCLHGDTTGSYRAALYLWDVSTCGRRGGICRSTDLRPTITSTHTQTHTHTHTRLMLPAIFLHFIFFLLLKSFICAPVASSRYKNRTNVTVHAKIGNSLI